eukprot:PITA_04896
MSHPIGLLQPLPIPEGKWESISMDFITGLPIVQGKDCIFVVVDRLMKYTHFFAISTHYTAAQVAELFFREIFRLHGLPKTIVSDRDSHFMGRAPRAKIWIQESQDILRSLKDKMATAQNQQKLYADRGRDERQFEVGDMVYLRLQPYRQSSLKQKGAEKLKPHFSGPYRVIRKIGQVAYELELPQGSKIHNIFHVSCLKKALGQ